MESRVQQALREFAIDGVRDCDLAVTLNMKQIIQKQCLDEFKSQENLRHFLNRLNREAFGNAANRYDRKVHVFSSLEKPKIGRWHYHLALKNPFASLSACEETIIECWSKTHWGYGQVHVQKIYDAEGWLNYITKNQPNGGWDIMNTHLVR